MKAVKPNKGERLAETAIFKVLSTRAARFKKVVDLLKRRLQSRECRALAERHKVIIEQGWRALRDARY
jgi:hypothetical protein